jgi:transcriptional regulator with XRE-family HTH domain
MCTHGDHRGEFVTRPKRPPFLRRKLGAKLRRLREQSGHTLDEAAPKLDKTRSALHRIENGETRADVHLIRSMMDIYDCYDPDLIDEAREALKPRWFRAFGVEDLGYIDVETEAAQVNEFSLAVVPGLMQTKAYMQAVFDQGYRRSPREINNDVVVRLIRQRRLTDEDRPLEIIAVIAEAVLHREVGSLEVMREQLRHLVEISALPTVTLQVTPLKYSKHDVPAGAFALLGFADPADPELLYIEYVSGSLHIEDDDEVREARLVFDQLRTDALSPADSVALIERLAIELYGP